MRIIDTIQIAASFSVDMSPSSVYSSMYSSLQPDRHGINSNVSN